MTLLRVLAARLGALFRGRRLDGELDEELRAHLEMQVEENLERGMPPEEARRAALRAFGGVMQAAEACRERRGLPFLENLARDARFGLRLLASHPAFALGAIIPLAVAIGFNTAVFTLMDAVLFRPMGFADPDSLVAIYGFSSQYRSLSYPEFEDIRSLPSLLRSSAAFVRIPVNTNFGDGAQRLGSEMVTGEYFRTLGVTPALGRPLGPQDDTAGAPPAVVISHVLWETRFGRSRSALGTAIRIGDVPFTVVGVAPRDFVGAVLDWAPAPTFWIPLARFTDAVPKLRALHFEHERRMQWLLVTARLRKAGGARELQAALDVVSVRLGAGSGFRALASSRARFFPIYRDSVVRFAWALGAICGMILLIACFNLANLLLARVAAREKEISTRLAVGAGAGRILQQFMVESVTLAACAVALGLPLSLWLTRCLASFKLVFAIPLSLNLRPDPRVLLWSAAAGLGTGVLVGIPPALRAARADVAAGLKGVLGGPAGRASRFVSLRDVFVAAQVACAMVMLVSAVVLGGSLRDLEQVPLGYAPRHVLLASLDQMTFNAGTVQNERFYRTLLAELRSEGVLGAALASPVLPGNERVTTKVAPMGSSQQPSTLDSSVVSDGYFGTVGMAILAGRGFLPSDDDRSRPVVVLNRSAADLFWPGENPLGRRIRIDGASEAEVVGVAADAKYHSLTDTRLPYLFRPLAQCPLPVVTIHLRTARDPMEAVPILRRTVDRVAKGMPLFNIHTLEDQVASRLSQIRLAAAAAEAASVVGILLALAGLFAVAAYRVAQQQGAIAIRLALGAGRRRILALFAAKALMVGLAGVAAGTVASVWAAALLRSAVEGVEAAGAWLFVAAALVLLVAVVAATLLAVRRILRLDPAAVLRVQ